MISQLKNYILQLDFCSNIYKLLLRLLNNCLTLVPESIKFINY